MISKFVLVWCTNPFDVVYVLFMSLACSKWILLLWQQCQIVVVIEVPKENVFDELVLRRTKSNKSNGFIAYVYVRVCTPCSPPLVIAFIPDKPKLLSSTNSVAFVYLCFLYSVLGWLFFHSDFIFAFIHFACTIPLFHFEFQTFLFSFILVFVSMYGSTNTRKHTHIHIILSCTSHTNPCTANRWDNENCIIFFSSLRTFVWVFFCCADISCQQAITIYFDALSFRFDVLNKAYDMPAVIGFVVYTPQPQCIQYK